MISYSAAIRAREKGQECEQALSLMPEMRRSGLEPDVITYSMAMSACQKSRQSEQAWSLLPEMRRSWMESTEGS